MLATPVVEHLVRFVYEGATDSDPMAGKEDELRTADGLSCWKPADLTLKRKKWSRDRCR